MTGNIAPRLLLQRETSSALTFNVVEVSRGDEVRVRVYFRNAAFPKHHEKADAISTRNARLSVFISRKSSAGQVVLAVLYADNATPRIIADRLAFVAAQPFHLSYSAGSSITQLNC